MPLRSTAEESAGPSRRQLPEMIVHLYILLSRGLVGSSKVAPHSESTSQNKDICQIYLMVHI